MANTGVLLIHKAGNDAASALALEIGSWLGARRVDFTLLPSESAAPFPAGLRLVIVLGGDGTIIGAARKLVGSDVPILGINFGAVGFLAPFEPREWQEAVARALAGELQIQACLTLQWRILRNGACIASGCAINDVVAGRGSLARLVNMDVSVDGELAGALRSDGLILASPLGSPGYAASAGGPILHPRMNAIGLVAICPYAACLAPLVLPGTALVEAAIAPANGDCYLTIDGQLGDQLRPGDIVAVTGRPDSIRFLNDWKRFFVKLGNKGRPGQRQAGICRNMKQ